MVPREVLDEISASRQRYIEDLADFLRIPSVSTDPAHAADIRTAAAWVLNKLRGLGFRADLYETQGHPVVFAQRLVNAELPTILIYGHYDVQPPDPLDEWVSPPFTPSIRDNFIHARGATDNKGQCLTYIEAMEAILTVAEELPINVKVLIEGEEEIGSPHLGSFLQEHQGELRTDAVAISDGSQFSPSPMDCGDSLIWRFW